MNQASDNVSINSKLGEHIGGSRADRALLQNSTLESRWMRSWKIVPREGGIMGTYFRVESRKLYFRGQYPSYEDAENALAVELACRLLEPFKDPESQRWGIRQRRDAGIVVSRETWSSFNGAMEVLRDPRQCKSLLQRELVLSDRARREAAAERARRKREDGSPAFPAGWEAREEDGGWRVYRHWKPAAVPLCASLGDALEMARLGFVRDQFRIVDTGAGDSAIVRKGLGGAGRNVVKEGFASWYEANGYMTEHLQEFLDMAVHRPRPASDVQRVPLKDARREGPERRAGPADPEAFLTAFGFHGVEFGLWNSQAERQRLLDQAWDGLMDLAEVLGVPPKALSLDGQLSLAFGARGNGGTAAAHYEYGHAVINLTKRGGAGCLAHEWFHALDHYLARRSGRASGIRTPLADGGSGYVVPSPEKASYSGSWPMSYGAEIKGSFADAWQSLRRAVYGKVLSSDYYNNAAKLDRGRKQSYWAKPQEMAARAFEAWVEDCIESQGRISEFLVNGTRKSVSGICPYPEGLERSRQASAFRELAVCMAQMLAESLGQTQAAENVPSQAKPRDQTAGGTPERPSSLNDAQSEVPASSPDAGCTHGAPVASLERSREEAAITGGV